MEKTAANLNELSTIILDCALHTSLYSFEDLKETLLLLGYQDTSAFEKEWEKLVQNSILIQEDIRWVINDSFAETVKGKIQSYFATLGMSPENFKNLLGKLEDKQESATMLIRVMGRIYSESIVFSDYDWDSNLMAFCDTLVKQHILFRRSSSSKKHSYRTYYLRAWPFDCHEIITETILRRLNVSGLSGDEWCVMGMLLLSEYQQIEYDDIRRNLQLTEIESREMVNRLRSRGLVEERPPTIGLQKSLQTVLGQYFAVNVYPTIRAERLESMKRRVAKSISNLWVFMNAKRIAELPFGSTKSDPIAVKTVKKSELKQFENEFSDMSQLGLILDLEGAVIVFSSILSDVENWLKGSINTSLVLIPANDPFLAKRLLQDIFSKCEDYVKIQDPYLGEETFDVLEYLPKDLEVRFLTGVALGSGEDPDRIRQLIGRAKNERRFQTVFVGADRRGEAPFHDRFILSANRGWSVGTSLKQLGRGKDSSIAEISKSQKDEILEPAFDRW